MTEPKDGDFAAYLQQQQAKSQPTSAGPNLDLDRVTPSSLEAADTELTISAETLMDDEALERLAAEMREREKVLGELPPLTDEEFERQALEAGGDDGNPNTPE